MLAYRTIIIYKFPFVRCVGCSQSLLIRRNAASFIILVYLHEYVPRCIPRNEIVGSKGMASRKGWPAGMDSYRPNLVQKGCV